MQNKDYSKNDKAKHLFGDKRTLQKSQQKLKRETGKVLIYIEVCMVNISVHCRCYV